MTIFEGEVQAVQDEIATVTMKQMPDGILFIGKCKFELLAAKNIGIHDRFKLILNPLGGSEFEKISRGILSAQEVENISRKYIDLGLGEEERKKESIRSST
jgi:hypothetical protein